MPARGHNSAARWRLRCAPYWCAATAMHAMLPLIASLLSSAAHSDAVSNVPTGDLRSAMLRAIIETELEPDFDTIHHVRGEQEGVMIDVEEHIEVEMDFAEAQNRELPEEPESPEQAFHDAEQVQVLGGQVGALTGKVARFDKRLDRMDKRTERVNHREKVVALDESARLRSRNGRRLSQIHALNTTGVSSDNRLGARTAAPAGMIHLQAAAAR